MSNVRTNTTDRSLCSLTGILETTILCVDESYLGKKCARKTDTEDFNNAVDEIHKQEKSFFLRVCVRARAHVERNSVYCSWL